MTEETRNGLTEQFDEWFDGRALHSPFALHDVRGGWMEMVMFGPGSTGMHLQKRKQELVRVRNSIKWSTPKTAMMDTIQIQSLQRRDGEKKKCV